MLDFQNIKQYKENNRLEVKKRRMDFLKVFGKLILPFANTQGGIILFRNCGIKRQEVFSYWN